MRRLRSHTGSVVRARWASISSNGAQWAASRSVTVRCQSGSETPWTSRWPPLAQTANSGGGPGSRMRPYWARVRVVAGTKVARPASSVSSAAAVSVR